MFNMNILNITYMVVTLKSIITPSFGIFHKNGGGTTASAIHRRFPLAPNITNPAAGLSVNQTDIRTTDLNYLVARILEIPDH